MSHVTVLLTGVPQYVTLTDLSCIFNRLFNTDDVGTFKIRDLPNHPVTNKRQIALGFRTGYDAMTAQEKLDGYQYELVNGRQYTLNAKINKLEEYMRTESWSPERWDVQDTWSGLKLMGNVSDGDMYRAHAKLDAQLELLKKQKLIIDTEKELLRAKRSLKREYCCLYEDDSENEPSTSTSKRSMSREHRSSSGHKRSRSRELALRAYRSRDKSHSKERRSRLPQIGWHHDRASKTRELRSHSRERLSRLRNRRSRSRDWRSRSRERRSRDVMSAEAARDKTDFVATTDNSSGRQQHNTDTTCLKRKDNEENDGQSNNKANIREDNEENEGQSNNKAINIRKDNQENKGQSNNKTINIRKDNQENKGQSNKKAINIRKDNQENKGQSNNKAIKIRKDDEENKGQSNNKAINILKDNEENKGQSTNKTNIRKDNGKSKGQSNDKANIRKENIIAVIDLDSAEKPVPRRPLFVLIVRKLGKDMNKVIRTNNLVDQIMPGDIKHVLRYILKDLVKGQGYMTREEIMKKFRGLYPKNKDLTFVKNVIKDINDGKYPGLGPNVGAVVGDTADNDCSDDVIVVEKQYDVVTVPDSDDDDAVKQPIASVDNERVAAKPALNEPGSVNTNMDIPVSITADLANPIHKSDPVNPCGAIRSERPLVMARTMLANRGLDIPSLDDIRPANPTATNSGSAKPVEANPCLTDYVPAYLDPGRPSPAKLGQAKFNPAKIQDPVSNNPVPIAFSLPTKTKLLPNVLNPLKPFVAKAAPPNSDPTNHVQNKYDLVNTRPVNLDPANPGEAKHGLVNPRLVNLDPENPGETRHGLVNPRPVNLDPANPGETRHGLVNSRPANLDPANPGEARHGLVNPHPANLDPANPGEAKHGLVNPRPANLDPANPGEAKHGLVNPRPANSNQAKLSRRANLGPAKLGFVNIKPKPSNHDPAKPDQPMPGRIQPKCQASKEKQVPTGTELEHNYIVNSILFDETRNLRKVLSNFGVKEYRRDFSQIVEKVIKIRIERILSEFPNLTCETAMERYRRSYSMDSNATLVCDVYKNALGVELPSAATNNTNKIQDTAEKGKNSQISNEESAKDKKKEEETDDNSSNSLKVTAITITTSFNELRAHSSADATEEPRELIENIKEEIEFEANEAFDNPKELELDKGPQVTSITIMTSDAELFTLGQDDGEKTNEIKIENATDYDAGESKVIGDKDAETDQKILDETPVVEEETIETISEYVNATNPVIID